jgi:AMMECR1 domain-containing protein
LGLALATGTGAARAADELAPYRALAGTSAGRALIAAARADIERYFDPSAPAPADSTIPDWPGAPTGLYVSLVRGASTRACVGSAAPLAGTLAENLRRLAPQVVASDPRRPPVRREELGGLTIVVAFAGRGDPVADPMLVRPAREGLLIMAPKGSVAFLPGEARTVSWALREARRAGVLERASDASFQRFPVVVLKEEAAPVEEDPHVPH